MYSLVRVLRSYFIVLCLFGVHARGAARSEPSMYRLAKNRKAKDHARLTSNGNISTAF